MRPLIITVTAALILGMFIPADACPVRPRSVKRVVEQQVLLQEAPVYVAPQIISAPVKFRFTQRIVAPEVYSLEQPPIILQQDSFDHCHQNVRNVRAPVRTERIISKQVNVQGERFPLIAAALRGTARVATAPLRLAANTAAALSAPRQTVRKVKVERITVR